MILRQQGEEKRCRAGGQVVDVTPGQWADDHGEEDGREESGVDVSGNEERLRYLPVSLRSDLLERLRL